jgi:hypothetical protein
MNMVLLGESADMASANAAPLLGLEPTSIAESE